MFPFVIHKRIQEVFSEWTFKCCSGIKFKHGKIPVLISLNQDSDDYIMFKRTALEIGVWCAREGIETKGNENGEKESTK